MISLPIPVTGTSPLATCTIDGPVSATSTMHGPKHPIKDPPTLPIGSLDTPLGASSGCLLLMLLLHRRRAALGGGIVDEP